MNYIHRVKKEKKEAAAAEAMQKATAQKFAAEKTNTSDSQAGAKDSSRHVKNRSSFSTQPSLFAN